jgi:hypothetical protein
MYNLRQHIAVFLLLAFLGVQAMALHSFSHDDDSAHCSICTLVNHSQQTPAILTDGVQFETLPAYEVMQDVAIYYAFAKAESPKSFYPVRPPPFITC